MKSLLITKPGEIEIIDQPFPETKPEEVLLKIKYVGFCGSDLSTYLGKNPMVSYPRIPGHEVAATIVKAGDNVPDQYEPGQKATVIPYTSCGSCASCKKGRFNACQNNETLGVQRDGAMSAYLSLPWQKVLVEDGLKFKELAMVEPLTVGFHATNRGRITKNDHVLVLGCGMIGLGVIIASVNCGATVIAVDIDDSKLKLSLDHGAHYAINSKTKDLASVLKEIGDGMGPDVVIEAVGSPLSYRTAIEVAAFSGRVVCIGYAKEDIPMPTKLWVQKELDIMGSRNASPEDFKSVIDYLRTGAFQTEGVISRIFSPEEADEAVREWGNNPATILKLLLEFKD